MTSLAVNSVTEERMDRINAEVKRARRLPSLTVVMFVLPVVLVYWQVSGPSGLLADASTAVHVRAGQWILTHHAVPRHDLFSYTLPHKPWCDWEWGSDAIFALVYRLHGLSAVAGFALASAFVCGFGGCLPYGAAICRFSCSRDNVCAGHGGDDHSLARAASPVYLACAFNPLLGLRTS
jgi:hypothetical protein